jgi:hypothetical protein
MLRGGVDYSATLSLTSALEGLGGQRHAPAAFPPGKGSLCGHQGRCGTLRPSRKSILGPSNPHRVAILITLSQPPP